MDMRMRLSGIAIAAVIVASCGAHKNAPSGQETTSSPTQAVQQQPVAEWRPTFPKTPYPDIQASRDPAVVARGAYLFSAVGHCADCHVREGGLIDRDDAGVRAAAPVGGREWKMADDTFVRSPNITSDPTSGIGKWTDAQIARALRYAVDREGRSLVLMNGLGWYDDRDLTALVSYLRTVKPVSTPVRPTVFGPKGQALFTQALPGFLQPRPQMPAAYAAPGGTSVARGAYLVNGPARCIQCHSDVDVAPDTHVKGPVLAGAFWAEPDQEDKTMEINAPNLTPSKTYGALEGWTEDAFVQRFRGGRVLRYSPMPWENFRLMDESDLRSIYRYLRSIPPVDRNVGPSYRPIGWKPPK